MLYILCYISTIKWSQKKEHVFLSQISKQFFNVFTEKNLHICGPVQLNPVLFQGQLCYFSHWPWYVVICGHPNPPGSLNRNPSSLSLGCRQTPQLQLPHCPFLPCLCTHKPQDAGLGWMWAELKEIWRFDNYQYGVSATSGSYHLLHQSSQATFLTVPQQFCFLSTSGYLLPHSPLPRALSTLSSSKGLFKSPACVLNLHLLQKAGL